MAQNTTFIYSTSNAEKTNNTMLNIEEDYASFLPVQKTKDYRYITFLWSTLFLFITLSIIFLGLLITEYTQSVHILLCNTVVFSTAFIYLIHRDKTYRYSSEGCAVIFVTDMFNIAWTAVIFGPNKDSAIITDLVFIMLFFLSSLYTYFRKI